MAKWFSRAEPEPEGPFFVWKKEDHSVGVAMFDQEHQRLTKLMSQIHASVNEDRDRDRAKNLLEALIHETGAHFAHEERVMEEVGYPEREAHAAEHAALLQQAKDLFQKFQSGTISALALPAFLKTWLISHMQHTDRKYAAHMRRNGVR